MEMQGESRIEAPRERVWQALNDPDVLKASIAGCEELEKTSDNEFTAKVRAKVGPVSARFAGKVTLSDLDPPNGYRIQGEGTGGAAGFAKGGAAVRLEPDGDATILRYDVQATVGGKLAQIGSRLIEGTARKMADDFFARFKQAVEGEGQAVGEGRAPAAAQPAGGDAAAPSAPPTAPPGAAPTVPEAGAAAGQPAASPDLPAAPETVKSFDADLATPPGTPRSGPEMARAAVPPRTAVQPELDATPGTPPLTESEPGPAPVALPETPPDMRPTADFPREPAAPGAAEGGDRSGGPGGYRAGMARISGGNPLVWGIGILAIVILLIILLT